jgi:hypothetical protein
MVVLPAPGSPATTSRSRGPSSMTVGALIPTERAAKGNGSFTFISRNVTEARRRPPVHRTPPTRTDRGHTPYRTSPKSLKTPVPQGIRRRKPLRVKIAPSPSPRPGNPYLQEVTLSQNRGNSS